MPLEVIIHPLTLFIFTQCTCLEKSCGPRSLITVRIFKADDKFIRALTIIDVVLLVLSCIRSSEVYMLVCDKLLRALTTFKWSDLILIERSG